MKKTNFIVFILGVIFNSISAQNNNIEVTFKRSINLEILPEKIADNYGKLEQQGIIKKYNNYNLLSYTLIYNNNESLFFLSDTIVGMPHEINDNSFQKIIKSEKKRSYYKNLAANRIVQETTLGGEKLLIINKFHQIEWKLTKEKKDIGKYQCYKAILIKGKELLGYDENMTIETWYSPELPVPFGPLNFDGLPGLILELKLGRNIYYSTSIKFNTQKKIVPLTDGKEISQQEYSMFLQQFKEKMLSNHP